MTDHDANQSSTAAAKPVSVHTMTDAELVNPVLDAAVRARARAQIEAEQNRPPVPWQRRVAIYALTATALLVVVLLLNWVITGMHRIMDIWYPGSISGRQQQSEPVPVSERPFAISVITESPATATSNASSTSSASSKR